MAYLVVTVKGKELYRRELSGNAVVVGRSTECDLWLNDGGVSRRHCRFERVGGAWEVVDLGSRNGIVMHGERLTKHRLRDGDAIHVGEARIAFHADGFVAARPATPQGVGDSVSDTVIANPVSRSLRPLPAPRPSMPAPSPGHRESAKPAARLAFTRPPARPMPVPSDVNDPDVDEHRPGFLRRFLQK